MFKLIVCTNLVGAIGKDNKLLYHIPNDIDNFKRLLSVLQLLIIIINHGCTGRPQDILR